LTLFEGRLVFELIEVSKPDKLLMFWVCLGFG